MWRIDSGRYEEVAAQVVAAWEERCGELAAAGRPPLRPPQLMHSNLDSVEQIAQVRIPAVISSKLHSFAC